MRLALLCILALVRVSAAQPLPGSDAAVLVREHRAHLRAITLGNLAAVRGSEDVRALGRHIARDSQLADDQLASLARSFAIALDVTRTPEQIAEDQAHHDVVLSLSRREGLDFDRGVLAALGRELEGELTGLDADREGPYTPETLAYVASMRPMLARYVAEVGWISRQRARAS